MFVAKVYHGEHVLKS